MTLLLTDAGNEANKFMNNHPLLIYSLLMDFKEYTSLPFLSRYALSCVI